MKYEKKGKRIILPWGGIRKMAKDLHICSKSLGRILDGQKAGKWHYEYSFEDIRNMAISKFQGYIEI